MLRGALSGILLGLCGVLQAAAADNSPPAKTEPKSSLPPVVEERLKRELLAGQAPLSDVRLALTERNVSLLTNTLHSLYAMRWHRGVWHLLDDIWTDKRAAYPELSWDLFKKPPVRVALASTLNRMKIVDTREYQDYIRSQKDAKHEFTRRREYSSPRFGVQLVFPDALAGLRVQRSNRAMAGVLGKIDERHATDVAVARRIFLFALVIDAAVLPDGEVEEPGQRAVAGGIPVRRALNARPDVGSFRRGVDVG